MSRFIPAFVVVIGAVCAGVVASGCELLLSEVVPEAPLAPVVVGPEGVIGAATTVVIGTRQSNTALLLDDVEVLPASREGRFSIAVGVEPGVNRFSFVVVDAAGRRSPEAVVTVVRDATRPDAVQIALPARTGRAILRGIALTKPDDCVVRLDGNVLDIASSASSAQIDIALELGVQTLRFACADAADNESAVTAVDVERRAIDATVFALAPPPVDVDTAELTLTASCADDVVARVNVGINVGVVTPCDAGTWTRTVTLVPGENTLRVTAAFAGEIDDEPEENGGLLLTTHVVTLSANDGEGETP